MIRIEQLTKGFAGLPVLSGVDFEIHDGETVVIIGKSGGGKSVLLKHLCGLLKPDSGRVLVDEVDIGPLSERDLAPIRGKFGFLFQGAALFDSMTLFDNVAFPLREKQTLSAAEIQQRVEIFIGEEIDISSFSPVTAVRAAFWDVFFAPETETPVSAVACFNPDFCFIYKHIS